MFGTGYQDTKKLLETDNKIILSNRANLGETYLVTETGNERLGKQKLDLVVL